MTPEEHIAQVEAFLDSPMAREREHAPLRAQLNVGLADLKTRQVNIQEQLLKLIEEQTEIQRQAAQPATRPATVTAPHPILDLPMDPEKNDAKASTIREYLKALLTALWNEGDGFSSKRPLGNSSWEYELHVPLIQSDLVPGSLDEFGDVMGTDEAVASKLIADAIRDL